MTAHWGIEDPAAVKGSDVDKERAFNTAFRSMRNRITSFIALPLASLDKLSTPTQREFCSIESGLRGGVRSRRTP